MLGVAPGPESLHNKVRGDASGLQQLPESRTHTPGNLSQSSQEQGQLLTTVSQAATSGLAAEARRAGNKRRREPETSSDLFRNKGKKTSANSHPGRLEQDTVLQKSPSSLSHHNEASRAAAGKKRRKSPRSVQPSVCLQTQSKTPSLLANSSKRQKQEHRRQQAPASRLPSSEASPGPYIQGSSPDLEPSEGAPASSISDREKRPSLTEITSKTESSAGSEDSGAANGGEKSRARSPGKSKPDRAPTKRAAQTRQQGKTTRPRIVFRGFVLPKPHPHAKKGGGFRGVAQYCPNTAPRECWTAWVWVTKPAPARGGEKPASGAKRYDKLILSNLFATEKEAAIAYDRAIIALYGRELAITNFPLENYPSEDRIHSSEALEDFITSLVPEEVRLILSEEAMRGVETETARTREAALREAEAEAVRRMRSVTNAPSKERESPAGSEDSEGRLAVNGGEKSMAQPRGESKSNRVTKRAAKPRQQGRITWPRMVSRGYWLPKLASYDRKEGVLQGVRRYRPDRAPRKRWTAWVWVYKTITPSGVEKVARGKLIISNFYKTEKEAAVAYDRAIIALYGRELAITNFSLENYPSEDRIPSSEALEDFLLTLVPEEVRTILRSILRKDRKRYKGGRTETEEATAREDALRRAEAKVYKRIKRKCRAKKAPLEERGSSAGSEDSGAANGGEKSRARSRRKRMTSEPRIVFRGCVLPKLYKSPREGFRGVKRYCPGTAPRECWTASVQHTKINTASWVKDLRYGSWILSNLFPTEKEAAVAHDRAIIALYGRELAITNFPLDNYPSEDRIHSSEELEDFLLSLVPEEVRLILSEARKGGEGDGGETDKAGTHEAALREAEAEAFRRMRTMNNGPLREKEKSSNAESSAAGSEDSGAANGQEKSTALSHSKSMPYKAFTRTAANSRRHGITKWPRIVVRGCVLPKLQQSSRKGGVYKGVTRYRPGTAPRECWTAEVQHHHINAATGVKRRRYGSWILSNLFATKKEAAVAYDRAIIAMYGRELAITNFPLDNYPSEDRIHSSEALEDFLTSLVPEEVQSILSEEAMKGVETGTARTQEAALWEAEAEAFRRMGSVTNAPSKEKDESSDAESSAGSTDSGAASGEEGSMVLSRRESMTSEPRIVFRGCVLPKLYHHSRKGGGFIGVRRCRPKIAKYQGWKAWVSIYRTITASGVQKRRRSKLILGNLFPTEKEAAMAYDRAIIAMYGRKLAITNFPLENYPSEDRIHSSEALEDFLLSLVPEEVRWILSEARKGGEGDGGETDKAGTHEAALKEAEAKFLAKREPRGAYAKAGAKAGQPVVFRGYLLPKLNRHSRKEKKGFLKGVRPYWGRWKARIRHSNITASGVKVNLIHAGSKSSWILSNSFATEKEAAVAYDRAIIALYGRELAVTNFPLDNYPSEDRIHSSEALEDFLLSLVPRTARSIICARRGEEADIAEIRKARAREAALIRAEAEAYREMCMVNSAPLEERGSSPDLASSGGAPASSISDREKHPSVTEITSDAESSAGSEVSGAANCGEKSMTQSCGTSKPDKVLMRMAVKTRQPGRTKWPRIVVRGFVLPKLVHSSRKVSSRKGFKGVVRYRAAPRECWRASVVHTNITASGVRIHTTKNCWILSNLYATETEAAVAYDRAIIAMYGRELAITNFPLDNYPSEDRIHSSEALEDFLTSLVPEEVRSILSEEARKGAEGDKAETEEARAEEAGLEEAEAFEDAIWKGRAVQAELLEAEAEACGKMRGKSKAPFEGTVQAYGYRRKNGRCGVCDNCIMGITPCLKSGPKRGSVFRKSNKCLAIRQREAELFEREFAGRAVEAETLGAAEESAEEFGIEEAPEGRERVLPPQNPLIFPAPYDYNADLSALERREWRDQGFQFKQTGGKRVYERCACCSSYAHEAEKCPLLLYYQEDWSKDAEYQRTAMPRMPRTETIHSLDVLGNLEDPVNRRVPLGGPAWLERLESPLQQATQAVFAAGQGRAASFRGDSKSNPPADLTPEQALASSLILDELCKLS